MVKSYAVTRYELMLLVNRNSTTGRWNVGFVPQNIKANIFPKGSPNLLALTGRYSRLDAMMITEYTVSEGDIILDSAGVYWKIAGDPQPWYDGSEFVGYVADLSKQLNFPVQGIPYGFEAISLTKKFEDGFERGIR